MHHYINKQRGFTLIELMIVIGLIAIFTMMTLPYGMNFYRSRVVEEESRAISNVLARAQSHAVSGKEDSDWGIKFFHEENRYTLFKGNRYVSRDIVYDQTFNMPTGASTEGIIEIVFERHTGDPKVFNE